MRFGHATFFVTVEALAGCGRIGYEALPFGGVVADSGDVANADAAEDGRIDDAETPIDAALVDGIPVDAMIRDGATADGPALDGAGISDAQADGSPDALVDVPPTTCSLTGNTAAMLTIKNNFPAITVTPYWINYSCVEQAFPNIAPGATGSFNSWVTHPWRVRDSATHTLLAEIPPLSGNTTVVVP
jgi:hypothetical protein